MMVQQNMEKLVDARSKALDIRHQTEKKSLHHMLNKNALTPHTFQKKNL
jgi:hypothetical protein